ncbi:MAG: hypothetical protein KBB14_03525 [Thermoanaerobaculia bacterium]|nr:hypothetical protein [Thermoanaerobaculia bacterium]
MKRTTLPTLAAAAFAAALLLPAAPAAAHCDSVEGPVVLDAKAALAKGDVAPVLKWISAAQEPAVREAFGRTLAVRKLGAEAREVADTAFFETLVRLHRETEGAAYTGLKSGVKEPPFIGQLETALGTGSVDAFAKMVGDHAAARVREKFAVALEAKTKADASPADGRTYVAAYVDLMHTTKGIVEAVHGGGGAHPAPAAPHATKAAGHTCD